MKRKIHVILLAMLAGASITQALAAGDPAKGAAVFKEECSDCHSVTEGKNKKGPSLFNVVGRKAASIADFSYSDSMKQSGIVWTAEKIDPYITHPKKVVPGGKMKYDGLDDEGERINIIAYLMTLH